MSDKDYVPSDAGMGDTETQPNLVEAPTTSVAAMSAPEESGQGLTRPKSTTRIGSEDGEVERGSHGETGVGEDMRRDLARTLTTDGAVPGGRDHEHRGSSTAQPGDGGPTQARVGGEHAVDARPHRMAMRSSPPHPHGVDLAAQGLGASTALPTVSFYDGVTRDRRAGDEAHASACGPTDVPAGMRFIGRVDGACHDSMRAYEERHGRPMRGKTSDVHDTRTATARLSRARKKWTITSIPYHRRRHLPAFHARDLSRQIPANVGPVADGGTGVGGSAAIERRSELGHDALHGSAARADLRRDGVDHAGRVKKRRGDVVIYHDDSSTTVEAGETTGADDPGDSDYVPRRSATDGDDGRGRRVRQRTGLAMHGQGTPSAPVLVVDRRAQAQSVLTELYHYRSDV
ncbi:hypothetical protein CBR_g27736 [Chara braunii]|uniref:Uncharacterized protein n=1 Tax=Chara braunii TaxID=69332 RepID=A0A388L873_CHABU|nr:hypothetical protein CBR_g27736 [Chara braunii]|eukprot:GBG78509.1 hypothetical protein CBR_g27736 [Chara braunii]